MTRSPSSSQHIRYRGMIHALTHMTKTEGLSSLWTGLTPALARQVSYSSMCMVLYEPLLSQLHHDRAQPVSFVHRLGAGGCAGAVSIALANGFDVLKVQMQANRSGKQLFPAGMIPALRYIYAKEGWAGFSRGLWPNVQRGFIVNAAELGCYDHSKHWLSQVWGLELTSPVLHVGASVMAGFTGAATSNPIDVIKTRLMTQGSSLSNSNMQYRGTMDCFVQIIRQESLATLYAGFIPNWMRKGPWCVIFFVSYEHYRSLFS